MAKPYLDHLKSSADLRTSYAAVRAGFVSLALEKNRRATPYVDEARKLQALASKAKNPEALTHLKEIRAGLVTAAGVSDKAAGHLEESDKDEAIAGLIRKYLEPAGEKFVEELVFRFLLTRGDSLGGSMRNVGGALAVRKLTRSIISCLRLAGTAYHWQHSETKAWAPHPEEDSDVELYLRGLSWTNSKGRRTLVYNVTVPAVRNNIDLCLLDLEHEKLSREIIGDNAIYLALGELKGGIDPAGADEHWKTARTALGRIHDAFGKRKPATFFIGAAIEEKMANEIWDLLENGTIDNAANLTVDAQIASITQWLCGL
ncbi:MAG TPA: AvaI/BsoBI family type II restriction endonuclease [Rhizomicrobium sp.]